MHALTYQLVVPQITNTYYHGTQLALCKLWSTLNPRSKLSEDAARACTPPLLSQSGYGLEGISRMVHMHDDYTVAQ